ncbi:MAG: flagellar hook-length control protein FliK [Firmicutes bacterium]|nr:flagellar hook-length control protein FliK [Bacillota bacterium]
MVSGRIHNSVVISQPGSDLTLPLKPGQILFARVLETSGDQALIHLAGLKIPAKLETQLTPGTIVPLQVKELLEGKIILRLLVNEPGEEAMFSKLQDLGIRLSPADFELAKILLGAGQELTQANLAKLRALFPKAPPDPDQKQALLFMLKQQIPLTKANLTLFQIFVSKHFDPAQFFTKGFRVADDEGDLAKELEILLKTPVKDLISQEKGFQRPVAFFTALKILNSLGQRDFLNQLLSLFIPVLVEGKMYQTRVTIEGETKNQKRVGALRLTFDINTANLGTVQVELTLLDSFVDCRVLTDPEAKETIAAHCEELRARLAKLGFTTRTLRVQTAPSTKDLDEAHGPAPLPLDLRL